MFAPKQSIIVIWLIVIPNCMPSRYTQLSVVDSAINGFLADEMRLWNDIMAQSNRTNAQNATLSKIFDYFDRSLTQLTVGRIEIVEAVNNKLAEHIRVINETQQDAARWLTTHNYADAYERCENIIQRIPSEISEIFEMTKMREFLTYIRENSDYCQTYRETQTNSVEELSLQNTVMDFYTTVAEALIKGYMSSQLAYMVLGIKSNR